MIDGFAHVGVSTHDMETTIEFYAKILGCRVVADERIEIGSGGVVRQTSIDVGQGQYLVFMEAIGVEGISAHYDTGINGALGVPGGMYHYALRLGTLEALEVARSDITAKGVEVSEITDLGVAKSIFLNDPNGLQLELSVKVREFESSDIGRVSRAEIANDE